MIKIDNNIQREEIEAPFLSQAFFKKDLESNESDKRTAKKKKNLLGGKVSDKSVSVSLINVAQPKVISTNDIELGILQNQDGKAKKKSANTQDKKKQKISAVRHDSDEKDVNVDVSRSS